jgi:hypothetical protein
VDRPFQIGDTVRVIRLPDYMEASDYPFPEVRSVFETALGKAFLVDYVDWVDGFLSAWTMVALAFSPTAWD